GPPLTRSRERRSRERTRRAPGASGAFQEPFAAEEPFADGEVRPAAQARSPAQRRRSAPIPAQGRGQYPPAPPEQLSFEDPPTRGD
ncbi:MAG TPA: hypothetical protein VKG62_04645, partial [Solirubrobacteraceae bacterium]|nr:hypothetical protein [Solirubrobacteraceae bacterium]